MKYKLLRFSLLSMLVMLFGGVSSVWADDTSGTIKFGTNDVKINASSVTGDDDQKNTWTITTVGTTSFTANASYYQVGSGSNPATSITFSTTLPKDVNITSFSAKFGGFNSTAGNISLKVDETEVGSGSLNASNDVTVESTKSETGKVLTVSVTNIDKGVKCYYISYTYNDQTDQRVKTSIVFADGYATEGMEFTTIDLPTATVKDANENTIEGAAITWTSSNEEVATISGTQINLLKQGTSVIKATYAGDETAYRGSEKSYTLTVTETDQIANPYVYVFDKKTFDENDLTKKLKNVTWTVTTNAGYFGYDTNDTQKGQQFGSGSKPATYLTVKLSDIPGTITSVKVNTSGGKDIAATFGIKVGETDFKYGEATTTTLTSTATEYEFAGSASGDVVISYTQTSSVAIYIKSIEITYKTETGEEGWRDIKADLTSESLLPEGAKQWDDVSTGIAVAADGKLSRVAKDAENAEAIFNGKWHGAQYGWANFSATVKVEGCVKITLGQNNYGKEAIVKNANGNVVAKIDNMVAGKVWSPNNPTDLISVGYYRVNEPTTLTLEYGSYLGYFAVEAIDPADLPEEITEYTITFDKGEVEGIAPTAIKVENGKTATIPANRTLWVDGKTLTAWTDGTNQFAPGSVITPTADMTLTPVFTDNTTSFDKRTTEVTALWDFTQKTGGAPLIAIEGANNSSAFVVTQIDVNGSTIDFRFDVDATSGKFNNSNGEWCQINNGTKFTAPAYKGAQYTIYSMGDSGDATFNGETGTYANNNNTYTYNGDAESMEIVIKSGTWFKTLTAVYPVPAEEPKPLYITGNFQEGGWSTSAPVEMTFNEESSNYEYELTVNQAPMYFTIATGKADSWEGFGEYRMGIAAGDQTVTTDTEYQLANYADGTLVLNETGTFVVSVTSDLKMTITRKADTYVVAGAFVDANNESTAGMFINAWSADQESNVMWLDEETGLYTKEYSVTFNAPVTIEYKIVKNSNVWYGDPNNNDPEDINKNYKYAITETGIYDITVTFDTKNELATMTATKQNSGDEPTESIVYSWEGNKDGAIQTGGTASATDATGADLTADDINIANSTFYVMRVRGAKDFSTNVINIALEKALKAGDKIAITAYRNKDAADKQTGALLKFEKGETTVSTATSEKAGLEFVNIDTSEKSAADQNRGTEPNTVTLEVPTDAAGSKTITMTRAITGTNLFITKIVITTTGEGGDEPEEPAEFTFRDFNTELNTLTENDESEATVTFGLSVAEDGTVSRVAADAENTAAVITGKTGNNHGLRNFSATVPVEGAVKITMGTCFWGGEVTVKDATGATVATFTTQKGESGAGCYKGNKFDDENIVSAKYVGDATTLTISGGAYVNFFAVEAIEASSVDVAYSLGEVECEGDILPTGGTFAAGDEYTIPAKNFTLYKDGYTLTGWSDGKNTYAAGDKITLSESITLTPVFTQNEVSLADRTEPVTVKWNFRRDQGAPAVGWEGQDGLIWVAQATIGDKTIDVALPFSTAPGKFNNKSNTDWVQINNGTTFHVPSCKGATISMEAYSDITTTTIDGQTDYTQGKTISYTIAGSAENVDVVIGDGSYYRYIQAVLPVVQSAGGETFDNVAGTITWPVGNETSGLISDNIKDAISATSVSVGNNLSVSAAKYFDTDMVKYQPGTKNAGNVEGVMIEYRVKPKAGITFKPTNVSYDAVKVGTDGATFSWSYTINGQESTVTDVDAATVLRNNGANSSTASLNHSQEITADAANEFTFRFYISKTANDKQICIGNVIISGIVNGTVQDVAQYTLTAVASPEEGGSVNIYPAGGTYDEGTTLKLTATENFGYDFVNWTNEAGEEVSTDAVYTFDITKNEILTANFQAVETYELALTVDGTNDYMVTVSPAPDVVDGKWMYEAGTTVELTANQYEGLVTFTNWSDSETASNKIVKMDGNVTLTAIYTEADIIAGWDFYTKGGEGRKADFAAQDNDADALSLVNTETGETSGWLDKSTMAAGGYESFKGAAVNWRTGSGNGDVGHWHWQTKVNAEAFESINVQFQMLYNYNAYQRYDAEYSMDGETWTRFGSITMEGAKNPASFSEQLPAECNNQAELYIRMIADKTSQVAGTPSANDGNTLAMFFITGTPKIVDDGTAPVLVSTVPANGAEGVSASGKIVLTFDERVKVVEGTVAYLNNSNIKSVTQNPMSPTVSGKVVTFEYKGLDYGTKYNFVLAGKTVGDLTDNMIQDAIEISFTTMERPTVEKGLYDKVVSNVDELLAAIEEANNRADQTTRFRIFIKKGSYTIPLYSTMKTCNSYEVPECITFIKGKNISFIGEDRDATVITNGIPANATFAGEYGTTSKYDGIGNSDVFQITSAANGLYWQDLTVETGMEDARGRDIAIQDKGSKNIYKNVTLHGYQDTWTSNNDNGLYYFEDGVIRGRTDYICGKGDIYFNQVEFRQIAGGYCAVPSKPANIGWVMKDCTINGDGDGVDGNYTLGRPWGSGTPVALWIDTKMNVVPSAIGWNEMSGGWPARFAEYNSMTSTGSQVDLSGRKKTFGDNHANNPILTAEEAAEYSDMSKMYGEWQPTLATEQAPIVTDVKLTGGELTWTGSNYALLYAIVKNGEVIDFTKETTYNIGTAAGSRRSGSTDQYQIRAANEMGGLNEASEVATETDGIETVNDNVNVNLNDNIYNLQGIRVNKAQKGVYIIGGRKVVIK
jgi:hypothetical protein